MSNSAKWRCRSTLLHFGANLIPYQDHKMSEHSGGTPVFEVRSYLYEGAKLRSTGVLMKSKNSMAIPSFDTTRLISPDEVNNPN